MQQVTSETRKLHTDTPLDVLIGKTISSFGWKQHPTRHPNSGEAEIVFITTDNEKFFFRLCADCCSETWLSDVGDMSLLLGQKVDAIYEYDLSNYDLEDDRVRQDCDAAYGYYIGNWPMIFRNSSNGYYGGWIERVSNPPLNKYGHPDTDSYDFRAPYCGPRKIS